MAVFSRLGIGAQYTGLPFGADYGKKCSSTAESQLLDQSQQPSGNMHAEITTVFGTEACK